MIHCSLFFYEYDNAIKNIKNVNWGVAQSKIAKGVLTLAWTWYFNLIFQIYILIEISMQIFLGSEQYTFTEQQLENKVVFSKCPRKFWEFWIWLFDSPYPLWILS